MAGSHDVAGSGVVAVGEFDPRVADLARGGELGLDDPGQFGSFGVGACEEECVFPGEEVSQVLTGRSCVGGFLVCVPDPAVGVVGREHLAVGLAEPEGCGSTPTVHGSGAPRAARARAEFAGDGVEHAARLDRAELVEVAGADHVHSGTAGSGEDQCQVGRGDQSDDSSRTRTSPALISTG